jgi:hypothetical protein
MVNTVMEITKDIQKKFAKDYFFIKGKIDIDSDYFIKKIKDGCNKDNNLNFVTNVQGFMTDFHYFNKDPEFIKIVRKFMNYIDDNFLLPKYHLLDSWGVEVRENQKTTFHSHYESLWSGVIYLNSSNQELIFNEIDEKVKPEKGIFALFSPFLNHGCHVNNEPHSKFGISFNMQESKKW